MNDILDDLFSNTIEKSPPAQKWDRWIAASLLQKSIRRGDVELAGRAAAALYRLIGPTMWKRLAVIAFEDVGVGCEGALKFSIHSARGRSSRAALDDERAAIRFATKLAGLPKDRSADNLLGVAKHHPTLAGLRLRLHRASISEHMAMFDDPALSLAERATIAWLIATRDVNGQRRLYAAGLDALTECCRRLDVPPSLVATTNRAARMIRNEITILAPLIHLVAFAHRRPPIVDTPPPPSRVIDGLPAYTFDKHTATGKAAIQRFVVESEQMRACLAAFVRPRQWNAAAATAAFHADAAPVARRVDWPGAAALDVLGAESDLFRDGVPLEGARPLIACIEANLDHLDNIRARLWRCRQHRK